MAWLPKLKIAQKLPLAMVVSALLVSAGVGTASYLIGSRTVDEMSVRQMQTVADERAKEFQTLLGTIQSDVVGTASADFTVGAVRDLSVAWGKMGMDKPPTDPVATLRGNYIEFNPNPAGQRQLLDTPAGEGVKKTSYEFQHVKINPIFRKQMERRGYADMFLFDLKGNLVYSVMKNDDFARNFAEGGEMADSGLGRAYRAALALTEPGQVAFSDVSVYAPAGGPASFLASPVLDPRKKLMGVLAVAMPTAAINAMMQNKDNLGQTGESFFVGDDYLMRSDSSFSEADDILGTRYENPIIAAALGGAKANGTTTDYRGMAMIATATPVEFNGARWAMVTTISEAETYAPVAEMRNMMLMIGAGLLVLAAAGGWLFSRTLTRPISRLTSTMDALAAGNLEVEVKGADRTDEIGAMAKAVQVFKDNAAKMIDMTEGERAASLQRRADRTAMVGQLQHAFGEVVDAAIAGDFSKRVNADFPDAELNTLAGSVNELVATVERGLGETGEVLGALAHTDLTRRVEGNYEGAFLQLKTDTNAVAEKLGEIVGGLRDTSRSLKTATGEILSGANDLSERTTKQAATIEETSAAMERLAGTVIANAERASDASSAAAGVTRTAEEGGEVMLRATQAMERITASSGKISNIIGLIDDIAFQTNLLALNASVEAARAGDAGKGFAVVAVEVRRLAQSAASASSDVKALIDQSGAEVSGGSRLVLEAANKLEAMLVAARSSNDVMDAIAKASREQAQAIEEVNDAVRQMDEMTQHNAALVEETNAAIEQTEAQAVELDRIVEIFRVVEQEAAAGKVSRPLREPAKGGIKALQDKVRTAARSYLSRGNVAVDKDWAEF
jgi:methyl-accepting chemotaxis protein